MSMLNERLQVLIRTEQRVRLEHLAEQRGTSVATLVREAIDLAYPDDDLARRRAAARHVLDAEPMDVPPIDELLAELDELRGR